MKKSLAGIAVLVASAAAAGYLVYRHDTQPPVEPVRQIISQPADSTVLVPRPRSPRPQTIDPVLFVEPATQAAYKVAKEKPALLEKMPCYCGCMRSIENHTSNLDCFADNHGAGCAMCRRIALEAGEMQDKGISVENIKKEIDARYAR